MESLNHNPNWLKTITTEIDKFLINCEYINFFMQMYMQWRKDGGSTSSPQTLIIPCLPCFEKLALSQFQLYIEAQTMTQFFVFRNFQKTILVQAASGKGGGGCILHMLRIHTGLCKWSKINVDDLHLNKINPFDICVPCINITKSELLFEQYRMALHWDKYDIEVRNDYAIKCNQIFFDFMKQTSNRLDGLYLRKRCLLIDGIMIDQLRKQTTAKIEKLNREKKARNKRK